MCHAKTSPKGLTLLQTLHRGSRCRIIMAATTYENTRLLTAAKGDGAITVGSSTQHSARCFNVDPEDTWATPPSITITRNWIVTGNGKVQSSLESENGEEPRCSGHRSNNYKTMAEQLETDTVRGWDCNFTGNPEDEAEIVQICYAVTRGYSDSRAPRDFAEYGPQDDGTRANNYAAGRVAYYNAYCEWRDAGYPVQVEVRDANHSYSGESVILETYTMTIEDAWASLTVESEDEVVVVEIENYDCPHCGRQYRSYAGRYNHLRKNQCRVLNEQE